MFSPLISLVFVHFFQFHFPAHLFSSICIHFLPHHLHNPILLVLFSFYPSFLFFIILPLPMLASSSFAFISHSASFSHLSSLYPASSPQDSSVLFFLSPLSAHNGLLLLPYCSSRILFHFVILYSFSPSTPHSSSFYSPSCTS